MVVALLLSMHNFYEAVVEFAAFDHGH